jgi:acyl-coenzyme A synthetase/AMP-(fatty) acid ligase
MNTSYAGAHAGCRVFGRPQRAGHPGQSAAHHPLLVLDEDGYLTITGRLKEIINRGGEKSSPAEVDDVLMDQPTIQQAMPHDKLGEEVAAA